jgi:hypothetical protein
VISRQSRLARILCIVALAVVAVIVLSPAPAAAETSYKRLKRKLRNFEWHAGEALKGLGSISLAVMEGLATLPVDVGDDDETQPYHHPHAITPPPAHHAAPEMPKKVKSEHKTESAPPAASTPRQTHKP